MTATMPCSGVIERTRQPCQAPARFIVTAGTSGWGARRCGRHVHRTLRVFSAMYGKNNVSAQPIEGAH